jgi:prolyl oligopeptidase
MRAKRILAAFASTLVALCVHAGRAKAQAADAASSSGSLPVAPVRPITDDYFGTKVVDPYRYMENLRDPELQAWIKAQNDYTRAVLARIPGRERLLARIRELNQSVPKTFPSRLPGGLYLISKQLPGEDVQKLYVRRGLSGEDELLVDPEKVTLAPADQGKGKNVITGSAMSDDGVYIAVGIVPGGDELHGEVHVIDVAKGRETGDVITQLGAGAWQPYWLPDNRSFVYGRLQKLPPGAPAAEVFQKFRSYLHVLGTDPERDRPVFGYGVVPSIDVDPSMMASVQTQPDSRYALGVLNTSVSPNSAYYVAMIDSIGKPNTVWRKVADSADEVTSIAVHRDDLYLLTYKNAPRYKIIRIDARQPDLAAAETVVPPSEAVVTGISPAQDALYVQLLDGGIERLLRVPYGPHPHTEEVKLPFEGSAYAFTDGRLPGALLYLASWTKALKVYAYDPETKLATDTKLQPVGPYDDPVSMESQEVKVRSYDGTMVPLSITYPKGLKLDGSNPAMLEGYGAYGNYQDPVFVPRFLAWTERGGVYGFCHTRGGGEYGEEWHLAGKGPTKPNTWRDFIACAHYLIDHKYTSPPHLAGWGASAGGILIGRAITERPDLFGAAIDRVGLSDTLRSELTPNGETNIPEFGSVTTKEGFKTLYAMSSYHHVEQGTAYPAVLLETGMNDPRIDPWQVAKMTARLQAATTSGKPILLRVEYQGGHGTMGSTENQLQETTADEWSFLLWQLGVPDFQPQR